MLMDTIDIPKEHLQLIMQILQSCLKDVDCAVYAFGSRVKQSAKKFSDLDLAIDCCGKKASDSVLLKIQYEFEESCLPFKVDIIDLNAISPAFYDTIKNDLAPLTIDFTSN
ncbi:hypothetical protein FACS189449_01740 [Alphaproteobacteria bacterium]|nr:hypothetical protein FACS189449_01740 [Alphaproteobacteria bacterium]